MKRLALESWSLLLYLDVVMRIHGLKALHQIVRSERTRNTHDPERLSEYVLCHAVDLACVFYFRQVMCLQRSAATALLLRRYGWEAELVIGAQMLPLKSHAWVEIKGAVVNDKPYMHDIYCVLERC